MKTKEFSLEQILSLTSGVVLCEEREFREIIGFMAKEDLSHTNRDQVVTLAFVARQELYDQYPGLKHWRVGKEILGSKEALDDFRELLKCLTLTVKRPDSSVVCEMIELDGTSIRRIK